jgi:predicted outer membrane repeat protein
MRHSISAVGCFVFAVTSTQADIFEVISASDSGMGTLREAVAAANALPGTDQIVFAPGLDAILLITGQINIQDSVIITGPPEGQHISGGLSSRILALRSPTATLTLENLVLYEGKPFDPNINDSTSCDPSMGHGGAVCAEGDLEIAGCTFFGNQAFEWPGGGAIYAFGAINIRDSLVEDNFASGFNGGPGGGITTFGAIDLDNTVVSNNLASGEGGGVLSFGGVRVKNSEISNNIGGFGAGGISARENFEMRSSTISGNTGGTGGIFILGGNVDLEYSTIVRNVGDFDGGGVTAQRAFDDPRFYTILITSTILGENLGSRGNFFRGSGFGPPVMSYSLFGDDSSEVDGTSQANLFLATANIYELADNGCAVPAGAGVRQRCVATHAMPFSSVVRDGSAEAGALSPPAFDQRGPGFIRIVGPKLDIGAFESTEVELLFTDAFE